MVRGGGAMIFIGYFDGDSSPPAATDKYRQKKHPLRQKGFFILFLLVTTLFSACVGTRSGSWGSYTYIPSPQPGLVLPINRSPAVWAECWLFEGDLGRADNIITPGSKRGALTFAKTPLKHFTINPPVSQPYKHGVMSTAITVPLVLSAYPANYTLLVFHQNFRGWVVKIETRRFSTTGNAFNEYHISGGRKVYADKVIRLAKCKPYEKRQFKFHRTFYPGHALKDALGLE